MNFELGTDGSGGENLIVKNGACKYPISNGTDDNLYMNGPEIFNFTSKAVPSLVESTLNKNNLLLEDIDMFVFHQANKYMLNFLRKKIGISEDKFYINLEEYGNTVSSTIPIALKEAIDEGKINGNVMLTGFGVGYSWGSCIIKINK